MVDPHIDDAQMEAVLTAEHVDTTAPTGEVDHLLPRDLTRRDTHALALNAVVGTQQDVTRMAQCRLQSLLNETNLHGQLLQPTQ